MKCNDIEQTILLQLSGELSADDAVMLKEHLAGCEVCRAYSDDAGRIESLAADASVGEPSQGVEREIIAAAETLRKRPRTLIFPVPVLRALASAACLVIVAGGILMMRDGSQEERIDELSAILTVISEDQSEMDGDDALYELADQLMTLQGFNDSDDIIEFEDLDVELLPTALRLRNTRELPEKKCV